MNLRQRRIVALAAILILLILIFVFFQYGAQKVDECEASGGTYTRYGCIDKGVFR